MNHINFVLIFINFFALNPHHVWPADLVIPLITIISRSFIIACRYGLISQARWEVIHQKSLYKWASTDFIKVVWENLQLNTILIEIKATKHRLQIEDFDFSFTFIEKLKPEQHKKLQDMSYYQKKELNMKDIVSIIAQTKKNLQKRVSTPRYRRSSAFNFKSLVTNIRNIPTSESRKVETEQVIIGRPENVGFSQSNESKNENKHRAVWDQFLINHAIDEHEDEANEETEDQGITYRGEAIFREIALLESQSKVNSLPLRILMLFRVLAIISIQFRNPDEAGIINAADIMIYFSLIMINFLIHYLNLTFLIVGIVDFRRKLFYMRMMSIIIDPNSRDDELLESHFLPTLNFIEANNLMRWFVLRKACLDFGRKYTTRIFIYCSVFLAFYGIMGLTLFLAYIGLLPYDIPINVYIIGYYDIVMILGILFIMIRTGAQINEYYAIHKGVLINHKENLWKVHRNFNSFKDLKEFNDNSLKVIRNQLKAKMLSTEERKEYIEDIATVIDIVIEKLDYDAEQNPVQLLGLN